MVKHATPVWLSPEDEARLRDWITDAEQYQLRAERARIVLLAAQRWSTQQIARALGVRVARVSKWRRRFAAYGLAGLENAERPGKPRTYEPIVDQQILALLAEAPPEPHPVWTGPLIAQRTGVSVHHIWRVLRERKLSLRRIAVRECETELASSLRPAGVIGLYLAADTCAFLIGVAGSTGALPAERLRSHVRMPTSEAELAIKATSPPPRTLPDVLQKVAALIERDGYRSPEPRTLGDFLADARSHWATTDLHAVLVSPEVPADLGVCIHPIPTFATWRQELGTWLALFASSHCPEGTSKISPILDAIAELVAAQRAVLSAAFEWHTWPVENRKVADKHDATAPCKAAPNDLVDTVNQIDR